jgi:hypothetical protein
LPDLEELDILSNFFMYENSGRGQDPLPARELSLRAPEDLHVLGPLPRRRGFHLGRLADFEVGRTQRTAEIAASQAPRETLAALREAVARTPSPD